LRRGARTRATRKAFKDFHWGDDATGSQKVDVPRIDRSTVLYELGELSEIAYITDKNGEFAEWVHKFKVERPRLCATAEGHLVIVGGDYAVNERGIVG
jgi:hypothetical protein